MEEELWRLGHFSKLKPVAACALGYPETGEMFVIATEDAGDATGLESAIARLLGNAVYQLLSYIAQKAMMLDNNISLADFKILEVSYCQPPTEGADLTNGKRANCQDFVPL
ncbi:hypothetical protein Anapl_10758 [Anas platyrhynchos]|uniref:Uncharacterized protein n=1 Tax=Anas platyrhynchos TaxID=8839 RepID=R0KY95_ANAPL|nr:hypothetical protein Anapl_10758 [Anas platyrhynchos]